MERSRPDWETLQGVIAGSVALPGSAAYDEGQKPFNARYHDVVPQAIVSCATPEDVSQAISFVGRHGLGHATRSGGHCFAGHSSTHGVLIDVTPLRSVSVSGGVATVGAGARLGDVYVTLESHGLALPAGTCPTVGIAGLVLGGGLGILGRTYGVTSDRLVRAQIVLADGRILECDENHDEDLFWALRGAGAGNFGVVTSFVFRPVAAPEVANFHAKWPYPDAAAVIEAWQHWAPSGPDELAASLKVTATGEDDRPPSVDVYGALQGSASDATQLLDGLIVRAGSEPTSTSCRRMSFAETRRFWAQLGAAEANGGEVPAPGPPEQPYLFSKSEFFGRHLPSEAIAALLETFSRERTTGESRELDFMPWGGAYNRPRPDATAFVHRSELFQLKHAATVNPQASHAREAARRWVLRSWASVHRWGSGRVFQNFADPDLDDWAHAYYGTNYDRLVRTKARYDPANRFRFHQSLPTR
ncbi:MAG TPA: FAD-binding oxidoreductase [Acidimicrobiales bacterium]|nr:FAD-binding oxidoreductase [Acidimicrobiales bacterium]